MKSPGKAIQISQRDPQCNPDTLGTHLCVIKEGVTERAPTSGPGVLVTTALAAELQRKEYSQDRGSI